MAPRSNLDALIISHNDIDPLVAVLNVLTKSSLFLVVTVAEVAADEVSRSVMGSVPRREFSVGDLPELERLSTAFESDKFLSYGVVLPCGQEDSPEVVVQSAQEDAAIFR